MAQIVAATGNEAAANALRQVNPHVCAAYPITPSTTIMERFASYIASGPVQTEMSPVESEHSAISACVGAAAAGGRVVTATSSQGLGLMWEILPIASGFRLPIVMAVANRAVAAPVNIHCDHADSMGMRDAGWILIYSENAQEVYDNTLQAFRIAEHPDVRLPVAVCFDGFIISHAIQRIEYIEDSLASDLVGEYQQFYPLLDTGHAVSYGPLILQDLYMEYKRLHQEVMNRVPGIALTVAGDFAKISGRSYGLFEAYRLEDAEIALVILNSAAGTAKDVVDEFRASGIKAGLLKPRLFRPFPYAEIAKALKNIKAICVMDRSDSPGGFGPLYTEIAAALSMDGTRPLLMNKIFGLGGRDFLPDHAESALKELHETARTGKIRSFKEYLGVRE
ncbi:MAG: pyruvate ferredoxin oxidoreductase [Chloroflexota bacterium]